jgi:hypothetical protein
VIGENDMKTAVITLKDAPNYGGILQAYALQIAVKKLGHECDLIDYMTSEFRKKFAFFGKPQNMSYVYWIYKKIQYPLMAKMMKKMLPFYRHMSLTEKFYESSQLKVLNGKYDVFIAGSDQVWACDLNYYDDSYFLSFVDKDKKRISYAASLGRTMDMLKEEEKRFIASGLNYVDEITLREESGIEVVKKLANKEAVVVLDPTLLLEKSDYEKVAVHTQKTPFILCYLIQSKKNDTEALKMAKKMSKERNIPIVKICRGLTSVLWGETLYVPTVEEWLGLFMDAEYIFTNSFHGVAFSVNFKKQFTVFVEGEINSGRNSRIYNICSKLDLLDRIKVVGDKEPISTNSINYATVTEKLGKEKQMSICYLGEAIGECTNDYCQ